MPYSATYRSTLHRDVSDALNIATDAPDEVKRWGIGVLAGGIIPGQRLGAKAWQDADGTLNRLKEVYRTGSMEAMYTESFRKSEQLYRERKWDELAALGEGGGSIWRKMDLSSERIASLLDGNDLEEFTRLQEMVDRETAWGNERASAAYTGAKFEKEKPVISPEERRRYDELVKEGAKRDRAMQYVERQRQENSFAMLAAITPDLTPEAMGVIERAVANDYRIADGDEAAFLSEEKGGLPRSQKDLVAAYLEYCKPTEGAGAWGQFVRRMGEQAWDVTKHTGQEISDLFNLAMHRSFRRGGYREVLEQRAYLQQINQKKFEDLGFWGNSFAEAGGIIGYWTPMLASLVLTKGVGSLAGVKAAGTAGAVARGVGMAGRAAGPMLSHTMFVSDFRQQFLQRIALDGGDPTSLETQAAAWIGAVAADAVEHIAWGQMVGKTGMAEVQSQAYSKLVHAAAARFGKKVGVDFGKMGLGEAAVHVLAERGITTVFEAVEEALQQAIEEVVVDIGNGRTVRLGNLLEQSYGAFKATLGPMLLTAFNPFAIGGRARSAVTMHNLDGDAIDRMMSASERLKTMAAEGRLVREDEDMGVLGGLMQLTAQAATEEDAQRALLERGFSAGQANTMLRSFAAIRRAAIEHGQTDTLGPAMLQADEELARAGFSLSENPDGTTTATRIQTDEQGNKRRQTLKIAWGAFRELDMTSPAEVGSALDYIRQNASDNTKTMLLMLGLDIARPNAEIMADAAAMNTLGTYVAENELGDVANSLATGTTKSKEADGSEIDEDTFTITLTEKATRESIWHEVGHAAGLALRRMGLSEEEIDAIQNWKSGVDGKTPSEADMALPEHAGAGGAEIYGEERVNYELAGEIARKNGPKTAFGRGLEYVRDLVRNVLRIRKKAEDEGNAASIMTELIWHGHLGKLDNLNDAQKRALLEARRRRQAAETGGEPSPSPEGPSSAGEGPSSTTEGTKPATSVRPPDERTIANFCFDRPILSEDMARLAAWGELTEDDIYETGYRWSPFLRAWVVHPELKGQRFTPNGGYMGLDGTWRGEEARHEVSRKVPEKDLDEFMKGRGYAVAYHGTTGKWRKPLLQDAGHGVEAFYLAMERGPAESYAALRSLDMDEKPRVMKFYVPLENVMVLKDEDVGREDMKARLLEAKEKGYDAVQVLGAHDDQYFRLGKHGEIIFPEDESALDEAGPADILIVLNPDILRDRAAARREYAASSRMPSPEFAMDGTVVDALPAHLRESARETISEKLDTPEWMTEPDGTPTELGEREWIRGEAEQRYQIAGGLGASHLGNRRLADAEEMERSGATREDIWRETGWWRGADGEWRMEIADLRAKKEGGEIHIEGEDAWCELGDMVEAPELFAAYPGIEETRIDLVDPGTLDGTSGYYSNGKITMAWDGIAWNGDGMTTVPNAQGVRVLTHEIQHMIQEDEEFARGTSVAAEMKRLQDEQNKAAIDARLDFEEKIIAEISDAMPGGDLEDDDLFEQNADAATAAIEELKKAVQAKSKRSSASLVRQALKTAGLTDKAAREAAERLAPAFDGWRTAGEEKTDGVDIEDAKRAYYGNAGEVEARVAEARRNLDGYWKGIIPPWVTEQIVRKDAPFKQANRSVVAQYEQYQLMQKLESFRNGLRHAVAPSGEQKRAGTEYPDAGMEIREMRFAVGAKRRAEYGRILSKIRPDLDAEKVLAELDKYDNPKKEKLALHWVIRGSVILPEDEYKVDDALSVAEKAKVDPFGYESPMALLEAHREFKPTAKPIDPDTVPELSDRREMGEGIVTYQVEDTREGQAAMRRIIDTHWGEDANPWCLLAREKNAAEVFSDDFWRWMTRNVCHGDTGRAQAEVADNPDNWAEEYEESTGRKARAKANDMAVAWNYWRQYSSLPKRVAFQDGKLLAFMATGGRATGIGITINGETVTTARYGDADVRKRLAGILGDVSIQNGLSFVDIAMWIIEGQRNRSDVVPVSIARELRSIQNGLKDGSYSIWKGDGIKTIRMDDEEIERLCVALDKAGVKAKPVVSELWWDRQDSSHEGIPTTRKVPGDPLGRSQKGEIRNGEFKAIYGDCFERHHKGVDEEWDERAYIRTAKTPDGRKRTTWYRRGTLLHDETIDMEDNRGHELAENVEWAEIRQDGGFQHRIRNREKIKRGGVDNVGEIAGVGGKYSDGRVTIAMGTIGKSTFAADLDEATGDWNIKHDEYDGNRISDTEFRERFDAWRDGFEKLVRRPEGTVGPEEVNSDGRRYMVSPTLASDIAEALEKDEAGHYTMKTRAVIRFAESIPVMDFLGVHMEGVFTTAATVRKMADRHMLTSEQIQMLVQANPVAVFLDTDGKGSHVILTDIMAAPSKDAAEKPVMILLRPVRRGTGGYIASAYSRTADKEISYVLWKNRLRFVDENRIAGLNLEDETLSQFKPQASGNAVLTSSDYSRWSTERSKALSVPDGKSEGGARQAVGGRVREFDREAGYSPRGQLAALATMYLIQGKEPDRGNLQQIKERLGEQGDLDAIIAEAKETHGRILADLKAKGRKATAGEIAREAARRAKAAHPEDLLEEAFNRGAAAGTWAQGARGAVLSALIEEGRSDSYHDFALEMGLDIAGIYHRFTLQQARKDEAAAGGKGGETDGEDQTLENEVGFAEGAQGPLDPNSAAGQALSELERRQQENIERALLEADMDWEERNRLREERRQRRLEREREAEENTVDDGSGEGEGGGPVEDTPEGMDENDLAVDILERNQVDIRDPWKFALFLRKAIRNRILKANGLSVEFGSLEEALAAEERLWQNPTNTAMFAKSMAAILRDMAARLMDHAGETYPAVLVKLEQLSRMQNVRAIEIQAAFEISTIARRSIKETTVRMVEATRKRLQKSYIGKHRFGEHDELEEDLKRKITGHVRRMAIWYKRVLGLTEGGLEREREKLLDRLAERNRALDEASAQGATAAKADEDAVAAETLWKLQALDTYGGTRYLLPGEARERLMEMERWMATEGLKQAARIEEASRRYEKDRETIIKGCAVRDPATGEERTWEKDTWLDWLWRKTVNTIDQRFRLLFVRAAGKEGAEAQALRERYKLLFHNGTTRYEREKQEMRRALRDTVREIVGPRGVRAWVKHMQEEIPEEHARALSKQGYRHLTYGQVMHLYGYLRQTATYGDNIARHGRVGQRVYIERNVLTAEDIKILNGMMQIYAERRAALDEASRDITGFEMKSPDPWYMPVKIKTPTRSGLETVVSTVEAMPAVFSERRRHQLDVDEKADIMVMFNDRMEQSARVLGLGRTGLDIIHTWGSADVKDAITKARGKKFETALINHLTDWMNGGRPRLQNSAGDEDKLLNSIRSTFTYTALGGNFLTAGKQTLSAPVIALAREVGERSIFQDMRGFMSDKWKQAARELAESDPYKARYGDVGVMEETKEAVLGGNMTGGIEAFQRIMMKPIEWGDKVPGLLVGSGAYMAARDRMIENGMEPEEAMRKAADLAMLEIEETQQSSRPENQPEYARRGSSTMRILMMFASSPMLQAGWEVQRIVEYREKREAFGKDSKEAKNAAVALRNAIIINHVVMPLAFQIATWAFQAILGRPPKEEDLPELIYSLAIGPFSRILLLSGLAHAGWNAAMGRSTYGRWNTVPSALVNLEQDVIDAVRLPIDLATWNPEAAWKDVDQFLRRNIAIYRHGRTAWHNWTEQEAQ